MRSVPIAIVTTPKPTAWPNTNATKAKPSDAAMPKLLIYRRPLSRPRCGCVLRRPWRLAPEGASTWTALECAIAGQTDGADVQSHRAAFCASQRMGHVRTCVDALLP